LIGAEPDVRTFGKYIGGGFSFGAFGGTEAVLGHFDTARPASIPHAGTFNNNVATMAAGCVVLGELYTAEAAEGHTDGGGRFRSGVADGIGRHRPPVSVSGYGSMLAPHALPAAPADGAESARCDPALQELLFLGLYERGIYTAPRGMVNLSLALTDAQLEAALSALDDLLAELSARVA